MLCLLVGRSVGHWPAANTSRSVGCSTSKYKSLRCGLFNWRGGGGGGGCNRRNHSACALVRDVSVCAGARIVSLLCNNMPDERMVPKNKTRPGERYPSVYRRSQLPKSVKKSIVTRRNRKIAFICLVQEEQLTRLLFLLFCVLFRDLPPPSSGADDDDDFSQMPKPAQTHTRTQTQTRTRQRKLTIDCL